MADADYGINLALLEFAEDEGKKAAVDKAERWHLVLEEMVEVANDAERAVLTRLIKPVKDAIESLICTCSDGDGSGYICPMHRAAGRDE